MNMDKLCVFATLWQIWHGNNIEIHANFEITCFSVFFFFFLVFASKCAIDACFAINLVQKDVFSFLGAKEASERKLPIVQYFLNGLASPRKSEILVLSFPQTFITYLCDTQFCNILRDTCALPHKTSVI